MYNQENLITELNKTKAELNKVKNELEIQSWGLNKTNEGIKILYKELEKKNQQLKKLDELKSDFVSAVSHELRTPLTTIKDIVSQVLEGILGRTTKQQREFLSICLEDIERLVRTINNLLDISKIEAGKVQINRSLVNIVDIVRRVSAAFYPRAKNKGLELKTGFSQERIEAYVDKDKIIQVLNNLLGNALKFTEKGYIEITVRDKKDNIECCISDTGMGMSKEELPKVFNKFEQFTRLPGSGEKSTGLGLAISKGIVELHQGRIWVASELNQGSKFTFTIPKYSVGQLLRQCIAESLKQAIKRQAHLSVLIFDIKNLDVIEKKIGREKISFVLQNLENLAENNLRHDEDKVIKSTQEVLIVLSAIKREYALTLAGRLQQAFNNYLSQEESGEEINISYEVISYPEDGKTDEELLAKIMQTKD
jgi:signal transduction histidine kinase